MMNDAQNPIANLGACIRCDNAPSRIINNHAPPNALIATRQITAIAISVIAAPVMIYPSFLTLNCNSNYNSKLF